MVFGNQSNWLSYAKVITVRPRGDLVEIIAVVDHKEIYAGDEDVTG